MKEIKQIRDALVNAQLTAYRIDRYYYQGDIKQYEEALDILDSIADGIIECHIKTIPMAILREADSTPYVKRDDAENQALAARYGYTVTG